LATPTAIALTDTAAADTFSANTGTLLGSDRDTGATLSYGITGGTVASGKSTKVGTYGTLELIMASGAYTYTPNATAIDALTASTSESFAVTVSDGALSATASLAVNITAANDTPALATPTAIAITDTAAAEISRTALVRCRPRIAHRRHLHLRHHRRHGVQR
jgi:VCBS repeat-containing protein